MTEKINQYVKTWENRCYSNGIPDELPIEINELAPCYKKIALAILKNDYTLKSLGLDQPYSQWYDAFKKIELYKRGNSIQLSIF